MMKDDTERPAGPKRSKYLGLGIIAGMVVISVAGSVLLIQHYDYVARLQQHGLLGLFIISIFAGSPIPIPTPSMILTFTMGSILSPVLVGLVSGLGNGLGNALIFWAGRGGHHIFENYLAPSPSREVPKSRLGRFFRRMTALPEFTRDRVLVAVFLLSIYPNPVLTPLILAMGATRYSFIKFFLCCTAGKTVQAMILAYLGYFGLRSLLRFMGVFTVP
jgi:membrane protein YqaA with SNARE-associated domain